MSRCWNTAQDFIFFYNRFRFINNRTTTVKRLYAWFVLLRVAFRRRCPTRHKKSPPTITHRRFFIFYSGSTRHQDGMYRPWFHWHERQCSSILWRKHRHRLNQRVSLVVLRERG